jgi:hypothetical protein
VGYDIQTALSDLKNIVEFLDNQEIKDLIDNRTSSFMFRDMADILIDLANCIDMYRDKDSYHGRRLWRIK